MRLFVALIMLGLCAAANAATTRHHKPRDTVVVRPGLETPRPPAWSGYPGYRPIPPSENRNLDPSNWGGG